MTAGAFGTPAKPGFGTALATTTGIPHSFESSCNFRPRITVHASNPRFTHCAPLHSSGPYLTGFGQTPLGSRLGGQPTAFGAGNEYFLICSFVGSCPRTLVTTKLPHVIVHSCFRPSILLRSCPIRVFFIATAFGATAQPQSAFGAAAQQNAGTTVAKYTAVTAASETGFKYTSISAQKPYEGKSHEVCFIFTCLISWNFSPKSRSFAACYVLYFNL